MFTETEEAQVDSEAWGASLPTSTREADIIRNAVAGLQERLPPKWTATPSYGVRRGDRRIDALIELTSPADEMITLVIECKRSVVTRDLGGVSEQLELASAVVPPPTIPMVVSRYLSPPVRRWLEDKGLSYLDVTGNLRLASTKPAVFLRDRGADRDPGRGPGRPRGTLKGVPAARVVRALVDFFPPVSAPELVKRARASTGATYRVLDFLDEEALITRTGRGVESVLWRPVLERWSEDYGFQQSNNVSAYLQPRGLTTLLDGLAAAGGLEYAITGSLAAQRLASYAPPRLATIYVDDPAPAIDALGLRAVDAGANVLLGVPASDVVFDRTVLADGVRYASTSQVAVDLLTGPGRNPAEAQELLDWMEKNESAWRRRPPSPGS